MTQMINSRKARGLVAVRADAGSDVKALIADLNKDWSEFKATMADKDKELAKKFDDVVTTEKLDRINSSVGDLQKAVDAANIKIAAMSVGAGGDKPVKDREYSDAFMAHVRRGDIQASLNKGTDPEGGYLAPIEWDRTVTDKLKLVSPMRQIASVQTISTAGYSKLYNLRGTTSGWVGEKAARPETNTPTFGSMTFTPGEIYANPAATQAMLDDAQINLESWLADEVQTEFAYQEGQAFISGDGTNKPAGFLTFITGAANAAKNPLGAIEIKTTASGTAITADEMLELVYLLPSVYTAGAGWVMNRTTQGVIRKLKDGQGNYLWQPSYVAGQPAQIAGYPVTEMSGMPDIALSATPIAFGDFARGYLIVDRAGVRVLRDPYTNKPYVMFYTTKRVGGGVNDPQTIKVLKMKAS
ncbi:phage major capsid protein [Rhizobium sp. KVB221]|uniref:Phage major capsid protein n=1 Tax=Rhizobium setariae TaxID=2801340 RepID=A0A936YTD2_9HYPH|nr:phage major capsid protein [Rhizobium setariae]MBL0374029.1 phage major capsid protein [Rhizobium setariae]